MTAAIGKTTTAAITPWTAPGEHLGDRDQPDRARRLDAILDLAGVAELGRELQGDRLDALEHDRDRDDAGNQDRREGRLVGCAVPPPTPWPIEGNT